MNLTQIGLIRSSFSLIVPAADQAASEFYDHLFASAPHLRPLFPEDLTEQRKKLVTMLATAVGALDRIDTLLPVLRDLGARHACYGVEPEHYGIVGAALIETLQAALAEDWTTEMATAWQEAYAVLSGAMLDGAAEAGARAA